MSMESALNPREIQSRIRAGESLAAVAAAAGIPEDKVEPFAGPVLAEREHITQIARTGLVRRRGDATGHRSLGKVITERLQARRLDADLIVWDAFRLPDRTWRVVALLDQGELIREAWFTYDPRGRFNVAVNADARWLIGEEAPPGDNEPDHENTVDLNDELALIRATTEQPEEHDQQLAEVIRFGLSEGAEGSDVAEVDALYDIAGPRQNQLDDLYETLSGINEDSVQIYAGLSDPVLEPGPVVPLPDEELLADVPGLDSVMEPYGWLPPQSSTPETEEPSTRLADSVQEREPDPETIGQTEPDQSVEEAEGDGDPKPRRSRRRRASVPAWDDILFGGPPKRP